MFSSMYIIRPSSAFTKDYQWSLAKIIALFSVLFNCKFCPLRQLAMLPTNVATSTNKMETFWVLRVGWLQTSPMKQ